MNDSGHNRTTTRSGSAAIALLLAMLLLVSACAGANESSEGTVSDDASATETSTEQTPAGDSSEEPEEVTLSLWYTFPAPFEASIAELTEICAAEVPHVTLESEAVGADYAELDQRVQAALAAGNPPDIAMQGLEKVEVLSSSESVVDLSGYLSADDGFDASTVEPFLRLATAENGRLVGMPWGTSVPVLYWNKAHFEEAGLDPEVPPTSLEEMLEFAEALKDPSSGRVGLSFDYQLPNNYVVPAVLAQSGASFVTDGELTLDHPRAVEVLAMLADAAETGAVGRYPDYAAIAQSFKTEQASMIMFASTTGPAWATDMDQEFGTAQIPYGFGHDGDYQIFAAGNMWSVYSAEDRVRQAAWELLKCFVSPEAAKVAVLNNGYLPTNPEAVDSSELDELLADQPFRQTSIDLIPQMQKLFSFGGEDGRRAAEIYRDAWIVALNGDQSAEDALSEAQERIEALSDVKYATGA